MKPTEPFSDIDHAPIDTQVVPLLDQPNPPTRPGDVSKWLLIKVLSTITFVAAFVLIAINQHNSTNTVLPESAVLDKSPLQYSRSDRLIWERTAFHFQPAKNFIYDPNGPLFYMGWYHLFYQYNPYGPVWGNMSWGHACKAVPVNVSDPLLVEWVKYEGNPILYTPPGIGLKDYRDPSTVWTGPDGKHRMIMGVKRNTTGQILVY
nr:beta-fructofuranosidase, soluble isoenzyme I-like [Tanacetum cinerariifolium]